MAPTTFEGKVALVTGASRGIGRALALALGEGGAAVSLLARSANELEHVARTIRAGGGRALALQTDVGNRAEVAAAASQTLGEFGTVDILINNAAVVWPLGPIRHLDVNDWAAAIDINITGAFVLTQALIGAMLDRGWGRIVNVSSGTVGRAAGMVHGNAYSTSKAALEALSFNLAAELEGTGVTVNVYRPGAVDTSMEGYIRNQSADEIGAELHARFTKLHEDGVLITPAHSAAVLLRRLSSAGTGEIWTVNDAT